MIGEYKIKPNDLLYSKKYKMLCRVVSVDSNYITVKYEICTYGDMITTIRRPAEKGDLIKANPKWLNLLYKTKNTNDIVKANID